MIRHYAALTFIHKTPNKFHIGLIPFLAFCINIYYILFISISYDL